MKRNDTEPTMLVRGGATMKRNDTEPTMLEHGGVTMMAHWVRFHAEIEVKYG